MTLPRRIRWNAVWAFLTGRQERPHLYLASRDGQTLARPTEPQEVHVIGQIVQADPKTLRRLYDQVAGFVAKRSSIAVLGGVYIEQNEFNLMLRATDMESFATASAKVDRASWGKFVVDVPALKSMLQAFKDAEYITMHAEEESTKLHVTAEPSSADVWMVYMPAVDFIQWPEPVAEQASITLGDETLGSVMPWVLRSVAKDPARPTLNSVAINRVGDLTTFVSTDSYRMHIETLWPPVESDLTNGTYAIRKEALEPLAKKFGKTPGEWTFTFTLPSKDRCNDHVIIEAPDGLEVIGRLDPGQFPNFRQLIPDVSDGMMVVADTKELLAASTAAKKFVGRDSSPMVVSVTPLNGEQSMSLGAEVQDRGSVSNQVPVSVEQQGGFDPAGFSIGVNPDFFTQGVDKSSPETWMYFISPLRPMQLFAGAPNRQALLMPIRLND